MATGHSCRGGDCTRIPYLCSVIPYLLHRHPIVVHRHPTPGPCWCGLGYAWVCIRKHCGQKGHARHDCLSYRAIPWLGPIWNALGHFHALFEALAAGCEGLLRGIPRLLKIRARRESSSETALRSRSMWGRISTRVRMMLALVSRGTAKLTGTDIGANKAIVDVNKIVIK